MICFTFTYLCQQNWKILGRQVSAISAVAVIHSGCGRLTLNITTFFWDTGMLHLLIKISEPKKLWPFFLGDTLGSGSFMQKLLNQQFFVNLFIFSYILPLVGWLVMVVLSVSEKHWCQDQVPLLITSSGLLLFNDGF